MKSKFMKRVAVGLMAVMLGCTSPVGSVAENPLTITAEAATAKPKLSASKKIIHVGNTTHLGLNNAVASDVKWSTSNKKVATVSTLGGKAVVNGKKVGKATITATYKGKKYKCVVTVKAKPVSISAKSKTLTVGSSFDLTLKNGGSGAKWSTSKKSVATIKKVSNTKYTITAKKAGTANIKVKYKGKTYTCKVTVKKPTVKLSATSTKVVLTSSNVITLSGTNSSSVWSIKDSSIAKLEKISDNKYRIHGLKIGDTQLTVKVDGQTLKCAINVYDHPRFLRDDDNKSSSSIPVNGCKALSLNSLGTNEYVEWKVSDKSVLELVQNGIGSQRMVYGLKPGTATVEATARGTTYKYEVTVTSSVTNRVYLSDTEIHAKSGDLVTLTLVGASGTFEWGSSSIYVDDGTNTLKISYVEGYNYFYALPVTYNTITFKVEGATGNSKERIVVKHNGVKYYCNLYVTE